MFTASCFIKKNTPELRNKLEELGYKPFGSVKYEWDTGWGLSTDNRLGEFESFDNNGLENIIKCESPDYEDSIDCGTNENLFLALAALRNDSDINQYFFLFNMALSGIVGGSGSSEFNNALRYKCDCFITGEIHHHIGLEALEQGICMIEVNHAVEALFKETLKKVLNEKFPELEIILAVEKDPFEIYTK